MNQLARSRPPQIDREAFLAAIQMSEVRALARADRRLRADEITLGRLYLEHLCAKIGEQPRAMRSRHDRREVEHAHPAQDVVIHRQPRRDLFPSPATNSGG